MPSAIFELFELICRQLGDRDQFVLTERLLPVDLLPELESVTKKPAFEDAMIFSVDALKKHFQNKGSDLPFAFDPQTGTFTRSDAEFVSFVAEAVNIRSSGKQSKGFEKAIGRRLARKLGSGALHNIGWPRGTRTHLAEINSYLEELGFEDHTLRGHDKDGGLDILWLPPLGTIPIRPLVSFQCKNARFNPASIKEAHSSVVNATRSIHRHAVMRSTGVYMCYVVFNDYLDSKIADMAEGLQYAPLGLSDLSPLRPEPIEATLLEL
jgi:hypothetical protein